MADGVMRVAIQPANARQNFLPSLTNTMRSRSWQQRRAGRIDHRADERRVMRFPLVGPVFQVRLGHIDLRVGKVPRIGRVDNPPAMVGMRVRDDHRIDTWRSTPPPPNLTASGGRLCRRTLAIADAGVEQHDLVAGIDDECTFCSSAILPVARKMLSVSARGRARPWSRP